MLRNISTFDRASRVIVAGIIGILIFAGAITGTTAVVLGVVAVVFLGTAAVGFCPLYRIFGLSTFKSSATAPKA